MNPTPVDLNRLKGILGNAKKIMQITDAASPLVMSEMTQKQINIEENYSKSESFEPQSYTEEMVKNSNLPEIIKQAMINNPIPRLTGLPQKFTANDILEDEGYEKPIPTMRDRKPQVKQNIQEAKQVSLITTSESQLEALIEKKLLEFFTQTYNKTITENVIKSTITTLIKEGKLATKKKTI